MRRDHRMLGSLLLGAALGLGSLAMAEGELEKGVRHDADEVKKETRHDAGEVRKETRHNENEMNKEEHLDKAHRKEHHDKEAKRAREAQQN